MLIHLLGILRSVKMWLIKAPKSYDCPDLLNIIKIHLSGMLRGIVDNIN